MEGLYEVINDPRRRLKYLSQLTEKAHAQILKSFTEFITFSHLSDPPPFPPYLPPLCRNSQTGLRQWCTIPSTRCDHHMAYLPCHDWCWQHWSEAQSTDSPREVPQVHFCSKVKNRKQHRQDGQGASPQLHLERLEVVVWAETRNQTESHLDSRCDAW
jgi:hypothetical protein